MKKYNIALALACISLSSFGQDVDKLIKQKDVEHTIQVLTADDMQGRATFTPGIEKAAQFIEGEFKHIGLQPLPGNPDFRQNFTMVRSTPGAMQITVNEVSVPANHVLIAGTTSFNWNSAADAEVVTVAAGQNFQAQYRTLARSNKKTLVLVDPSFESLFQRLRERTMRGSISFDGNASQQVVFVLGTFDKVNTLAVNYQVKTDRPVLFNIAGMIPGKTKPDEYVIFSGHYDHLGVLKPMQGDSIANGADDDASGTTAMITLARYYKKLNNNARTLIFVAFTAEEIGEYGSQYFAKQVNPDKTVAMFNIEMIGKPSKFGENSAFITGYERSDFGEILQRNLQGTQFKFYPDPYPAQDLFYRSDNASLARVGVPAHTISTDQIDVDKYYHTVKDELSTLDVANITSTIRAIALSSRSIVDGTDTPKRVAKLER